MNRRQGTTTIAAAALALLAGVPTVAAAAPAAADPAARPPLATGRSTDGRTAFRLEGRRLTVTLARRLVPQRPAGRVPVNVVCGESGQDDPVTKQTSLDGFFAVRAQRFFRVRAGVRTIRAQLDRDVARWANWCGLRAHGAGGSMFRDAAMTLRRGTAPGCASVDPRLIVAESDRALVTRVVSAAHPGNSASVARVCAKPAGRWRELGMSSQNQYRFHEQVYFAASGAWVAWQTAIGGGGGLPTCTIQRLDLAGSGEVESTSVAPDGAREGPCATGLALGSDGTVAWVTSTWSEPWPPDQLNVLASNGTTVTLDTAPNRTLADPAISADGSTVTWTSAGQPRSAPLP